MHEGNNKGRGVGTSVGALDHSRVALVDRKLEQNEAEDLEWPTVEASRQNFADRQE